MPSLWSPPNWPQRLAELQAASGELKEAPLRRDVRSLGMLLGEVLREQAGAEVYEAVEELRRTAIARREALEERPREGRRRRALPFFFKLLVEAIGRHERALPKHGATRLLSVRVAGARRHQASFCSLGCLRGECKMRVLIDRLTV